MITCTIYSTAGENAKAVNVEGGISFAQLKNVIGNTYPWTTSTVMFTNAEGNEVTVDNSNTIMPNTDFCLFIYPRATKSGTIASKLPFNAARRKCAEIAASSSKAASFMSGFTRMSAKDMNALITKWQVEENKVKAAAEAQDNEITWTNIAEYIYNNYHCGTSVQSMAKRLEEHFEMPDVCQSKYNEIKERNGF